MTLKNVNLNQHSIQYKGCWPCIGNLADIYTRKADNAYSTGAPDQYPLYWRSHRCSVAFVTFCALGSSFYVFSCMYVFLVSGFD